MRTSTACAEVRVRSAGQGRTPHGRTATHPVGASERLVASSCRVLENRLQTLHSHRRILVAEDNPVNQEVVQELLRLIGLEVDLVSDGAEAVARVGDVAYDLVLMDMKMPVMDGLEASRVIRALGHRMPIVALTANVFEEDRRACLSAGMNDVLSKPVNPDLLHATILHWLPHQATP